MALRSGHGAGRGSLRIEVLPVDELPAPVPSAEPSTTVTALKVAASAMGPIPKGSKGEPSAIAKARLGGLALSMHRKMNELLGLAKLPKDHAFGPYRLQAQAFFEAELPRLAGVAGGEVGASAASMVASAILQFACSRWAFDRGAETLDIAMMKQASALANDSRQNLLAGFEIAVREAHARPIDTTPSWMRNDK
jgi:hypothetical protein